MKRTIFILCIFSMLPWLASAQGKKDYKKAEIKKVTEYKSDFKTGKEKKIKRSETIFDGEGNQTEIKEWDDYGKLRKHVTYTYNQDNDRTSATEYHAAGKITKVIQYTLNENGDRTVVAEYDGAGKLVKTTKYTYVGKFITTREVYDASNKLSSKRTYEYTR